MNPAIFITHLQDALRPSRLLPWIFAIAGIFGIALLWKRFQAEESLLITYGQFSQILVYRLVALAAVVFSMGVIAQEIEQKTIVYLLTRSQPRWALLLGRSLASIASVALVGTLAVIAAGLAILGPKALTTPEVLMDCLVMVMAAGVYGSIFIFLSLIVNRAMIWSLLFAFGWETFAQNLPGMRPVSVMTYLNAIGYHQAKRADGMMTFFAGDMVVADTPVWLGWLALGGLWVFFAVAGMLVFSLFEYSPREDAE